MKTLFPILIVFLLNACDDSTGNEQQQHYDALRTYLKKNRAVDSIITSDETSNCTMLANDIKAKSFDEFKEKYPMTEGSLNDLFYTMEKACKAASDYLKIHQQIIEDSIRESKKNIPVNVKKSHLKKED